MRRRCAALSLAVLLFHVAAGAQGKAVGESGARLKSSGPGIPPVAESEWTEAQRAIVARFGVAGRADNDLATYLRHPVLAQNIMPFERYISNDSTLTPRHRELLILRTAWLCRSAYVWAHHADAARKAGMTVEELTRIARGPDAAGWDPFEATLLRTADELHVSAFVSDGTWNATERPLQDSRADGCGFHRGGIHHGVGHVEFGPCRDRESFQRQAARLTFPTG